MLRLNNDFETSTVYILDITLKSSSIYAVTMFTKQNKPMSLFELRNITELTNKTITGRCR